MATSTTSPDDADNTVKLGPVGRARAGVAALRLLTALEDERRTATEEERRVLAGWPGWGPLAKALEEKREGAWEELGQELRELLTPSQLQSGLEACTNSFYTPPEITRACWDILTGLGFDGGRVLEPGCGSGRFIASTPQGMDAQWLGVESDQVSAAIARHLHPQAMIMATPMEEANLPGNCADAVIGNVPFENVRVYDPSAPEAVTGTLHDYMIWSSVQALSPGGIAVLVTSCGTLDKRDGAARRALDAEAALIGAIRLPGGAFGSSGTETAADILVLRRRLGEEPQRNFSGPDPAPESLSEDPLLAATARGDWAGIGEAMNRWLEAFPDTVLGTVGRHEYRTGQVTVTADESTPWPQALEAAVATTVERATTAGMTSQAMQAPVSLAQALAPAPDGLKEGRILTVEREVTKDGKTRALEVIAQVVEGRIEEVRTAPSKPKNGEEPKPGNLKPASKELVALIELRDAALELFEADADLDNVSDAELAPIRERVLSLYEAYHDTYGPIGRATVSYSTKVDEETGVEELIEKRRTVDLGGMRDDVDLATLLALENYHLGSNTATPADILYRRINAPSEAATYADTPHEAVAISLNATNRVDPDHIATLLGIPAAQVEDTLISAHAAFRDPAHPGGDLVPAPVYLSGSIGLKLEAARKAAEDDDAYTANVQALEGARPEPLPPEKIEARLGAPWIPTSVIEDFARQVLEIRAQVSAYRSTGDWVVTVSDQAKDPRQAVANCEQWAYTPPPPKKGDPELYLTGYGPLSSTPGEGLANRGPLRRGDELLTSALNNRSPEIRYYVTDEKTARHDKFSRDADKVQERLQRTFSTWVWQDPERARIIADAFNRDFQSTVPPNPSGAHLTFPGMSAVIEPYSHQLEFVAMALGRKAAACIHDMGGGKTATMFMTAIKHVQLGLATNPIIVVPNGLLDDITRAGKQLFPSARILMATERDMRSMEARRRFARKCAANRWDAIVMTESMYSRIPIHPKTEAEFHEWYKADLAATYNADVQDAKGAQAKKIAKKIKARAARAKELLSQTGADKDTTYLEHLGSTMVLYDEASDWMRNLGEWVQVEGIPMSRPVTAAQGFMKAMTMQMRGGKAFLFTGTPMVRNIVDLYSIMLTVDREGLIARGIYNAEQFARTFIRMETVLEPTADGQGVKLRRRVREPLNEEQLRALFGEGAHVRMNLQLNLPELVQHVHTVEATPSLRAYASELAHRESQIKGWRQAKGADTYFSLVALGRAAALDPALIGLPEDGRTKLDVMAETIGQRYHQTKELRFPDDPAGVQGTLQLAFVNQGVPHGKDARTYGRLRDKLVAQGVPAERIAFVHDHDKPAQRARLYEGCRAGKYSVLIGSFAKMGYGVNVQDRLSDIHIADVGWNPADLRQAIKRGYRAGNLNAKVNVHLYPVTHSVDARFFALNEQRRVVEEAFLSGGNAQSGTMGEIAASDLGSLSAIAADNPRLMELQNLKQTLEDLQDSETMHESNLARTSANIHERTRRIELLRMEVSDLTPLAGLVQATPDRTIRAAGDSQYPLEEDQAHERLNRLMRETIDRKRTYGAGPSITYRGLSVTMSWNPPDRGQTPYVTAEIGHRDHPDAVHRVQMKEAWTRKGQTYRLTRAVVQAIDALPDHVNGLAGQISELSESNDRARQMLDAPFADAAALESVRTEVEVLEEELARESDDLAERAAKVEALALTEITTVLSDTEGEGEVRVGYDRQGQMALDVDVDHLRLVRPPLGWTETAVPGTTRTRRAVHGVHWQLTHHDSPVPSPLPFTAHIASTLEGLVRARIDIVPQYGANRGAETTALDGDYPTYADALIAVRDYLAVDIRDSAKSNLPRQVLFSLGKDASELHEPVRPLERSWWDTDIERLSRTTPGTLLRTGLDEAGHPLPARTHPTADQQLRDFNGRFVLIRLTTGPIHAVDIVVDERGYARLSGETRIEPQLIAEVLDLGTSLRPGTVNRYVAPGEEAVLSADLLWAAAAHPGDPLDEGSRSLNRHLQGTSGLNAVGKTIDCTIDRAALGLQATDTDRYVTVHGHLAEVDDATLTVHLDLNALIGGTAHERPLNDADALNRLAPRPGDRFKRDPEDPERRRQIPVPDPFPLRVPLSAVKSMHSAGRSWQRAAAQAVRAKVEEHKARAAQAAEPAPEPQAPPEMTPQRLAEHVRALAEDLAGHHETTDAALAKALTLLEGEHPDPLAAARHSLAAALVAAADASSDHPALGVVVDHVANGLAQGREPAPAVQLRQLYADRAPDPKEWTKQILADAHTWASTRQEATEDVPATAADLLRQGVEAWPRTGAGFDAAAAALDTLLDAGLYGHAHRMRAALREAFPGRTDDWRLKALLGRFDAMTTAAALIDAAGPAEHAPGPLRMPFPHGMGVLWGRDVVVLATDGQAYPCRVHAVNSNYALAADDGRVWAQHQIFQVRTTDNQVMALAHGEPADLDEALAAWGEQWRTERTAYLQTFHDALTPWVGGHVQVLGTRSVLAEGTLEKLTTVGIHLAAAAGGTTVAFEDIGAVEPEGGHRWWADADHNRVEQHLAAADHALVTDDHPRARRHLAAAAAAQNRLTDVPVIHTERWNTDHDRLSERARNPLLDGEPLIQIERSGPQGRTVRIYGTQGRPTVVQAALGGLMAAEPALTWSEEERAFTADPRWQPVMIDARLEQLRQSLDAAGMAHDTALVDHPEPELALLPPGTATPSPQVQQTATAAPSPAPQEPAEPSAPRDRAASEQGSGAITDLSPEHVQDGPSEDLTAEQQSLLRGAQERGFLMMGTVGAEELASGAAPAAPATHTEPDQPAPAPAPAPEAEPEASPARPPQEPVHPLARELEPWVGHDVGLYNDVGRNLGSGTLLGFTDQAVRLAQDRTRVVYGPGDEHTVAYADIDHLHSPTQGRWWSDKDHNAYERRLRAARASLDRGDYVTARKHLAHADTSFRKLRPATKKQEREWREPYDELLLRATAPRDANGELILHIERTGAQGRVVYVYGAGGRQAALNPTIRQLLATRPRLNRDRYRNGYKMNSNWRDATITSRLEQLLQDLRAAGIPHEVITLPYPEPELPDTPEAVRAPVAAGATDEPAPESTPVPTAQTPPREPEPADTAPAPATVPPAAEPEGLFAVEPQAPTAEDVKRALDNVDAIPNPVGVFNVDQTWLVARAREAYHVDGDVAAAAAFLTHHRMNEGKAASKLQAAVGHLVRFAPTAGQEIAEAPPSPATEAPAASYEDLIAQLTGLLESGEYLRARQLAEHAAATPRPETGVGEMFRWRDRLIGPEGTANSSTDNTVAFERWIDQTFAHLAAQITDAKQGHLAPREGRHATAELDWLLEVLPQERYQQVRDAAADLGNSHFPPEPERAFVDLAPAPLWLTEDLYDQIRREAIERTTELVRLPDEDDRRVARDQVEELVREVSLYRAPWAERNLELTAHLNSIDPEGISTYDGIRERIAENLNGLPAAVVVDRDHLMVHLPSGAPAPWLEAFTEAALGDRFSPEAARREGTVEEFDRAIRVARGAFARLPHPPQVMPLSLWQGAMAMRFGRAGLDRRRQVLAERHPQDFARLQRLIGAGEVREAHALAIAHTQRLREAGVVISAQTESDHGLVDYFAITSQASRDYADVTAEYLAQDRIWTPAMVRNIADRLYRESPHLTAEQVSAMLPTPVEHEQAHGEAPAPADRETVTTVGLDTFVLTPGEPVAVLTRHGIDNSPGPLDQLHIGAFEAVYGPPDAHTTLILIQGDQRLRTPLDNIAEVISTDGARHWRRHEHPRPLIQDYLGLHALTQDPHAPSQLPGALRLLADLPSNRPDLESGTSNDAASYAGGAVTQRTFTAVLVNLFSDGTGEVPALGDPPLANVDPARRQITLDLIDIADHRNPLGIGERAALRSRLQYTDQAPLPETVVRIDTRGGTVKVRVSSQATDVVVAVDGLLRHRSIGFSAPVEEGRTETWELPTSWRSETVNVRLRKAWYVLHREGYQTIPEDLWEHLDAAQRVGAAPQDELTLAQSAVADTEALAAGEAVGPGRGAMHVRAALVSALNALKDAAVERDSLNDLFVRANRADPRGAWEREQIRSQLLYPTHAHDQGKPMCALDPHSDGEHFDRLVSFEGAHRDVLLPQLKKLGFITPKLVRHPGIKEFPSRFREETREERISSLIAFCDEHGISVITRAQHQERRQARADALAQTVSALEADHLNRLNPEQESTLKVVRRNLDAGRVEGADRAMTRLLTATGPGSDIIREVAGPLLSPSTAVPGEASQPAGALPAASPAPDPEAPEESPDRLAPADDLPTGLKEETMREHAPAEAQENPRLARAREALQDMQEHPGVQTRAKAHTNLQMVTDEVAAGRVDRATALELFAEYARINPDMASSVEGERSRVALPDAQAPGFAEALVITHTPDQLQIRTPQPLAEPVHALLLEHGFTTADRTLYDPPRDWLVVERRIRLGRLLHALNTLPGAPERMFASHHEHTLTRAERGEHAVEADQVLALLRSEPSVHARERFTALLKTMLAADEHGEVARLAQQGDIADPAGWWERADLLSTARFAHDPEGLATAIRIDYDGAKSTVVRLTGDDSERPVRDLLKDKAGPYKARYDGKARHWEIKRRRPSVEKYRALLSELIDDLADLGHTWVTETAHAELTERHRAQAEAAMAAQGPVAPVNADGHVGELADVLTYPALRVAAVIRHKDDQGEPRDSWTVVYDAGQGAELTEYTTTEPALRRGQALTDVQVKIHDHAFSAQGEARTVIIRVPPRQERTFPLTPEQEQILAAAREGKKFEVHAGAGTGKTATIGVVAEALAEQGRRGIYVVYGRANADEAALKLAHVPVAANTIHAFARRAVGGPYNERINGDKTPNWSNTARALGLRSVELPSGHPLDGEDLARLVDRAVYAFELSADLELTTAHIPRLPGLSEADHARVQSLLKPVLDRAWADMCNPAGTLFRFRHDTYVKIWQLTPGGPKMRIGGQGRPYLLVDEAQDMNPVAEAIIQAQTHMQQGWVGDSNQAIHGWRGAEDALGRQNADVVLTLSQSFRFGEAVADEANRWLAAIDSPMRIKGTPALDTVVHDRLVEAPDAVLARTNAGAFNAALDQLRRGRRVAIVGGTGDLTKLVDAADKLKSGTRTTHPDLSHFRSWGDVVKCAIDRPEDLGSLAPFVRLVDKLGTPAVREALGQMTDTDPEVEVCTAHKSKGLEWDRVQIADDFAPKEGREWSFAEFKAEAQLAYVATTRARRELGRGSLAYIDDYTGITAAGAAAEEASPVQAQAAEADLGTAAVPTQTREESPPWAPAPAVPAEVEAQEQGPVPAVGQQSPPPPAEPPSVGGSPAPADVDPKEAFDHGWVPYVSPHGELEQGPGLDRVRALAASLPPKLVRALDRSSGTSSSNRTSLGWDSTPPKHMYELQGLEIVFQENGRWWFTHLGEAVHGLLWRHKYGPEKGLPVTEGPTSTAAPAQPSAEEEPQPTLFGTDTEPEHAPTPQEPERTPPQHPEPVEEPQEDPQVNETPEPGAPKPDAASREQDEAAPRPQSEPASPAADDAAAAERDRTIFDELADAEVLTPEDQAALAASGDASPEADRPQSEAPAAGAPVGEAAASSAPAPGETPEADSPAEPSPRASEQAHQEPAEQRPGDDSKRPWQEMVEELDSAFAALPPRPGEDHAADPAPATAQPAPESQEYDTEANRTRASRGIGPLRRKSLTLELPDGAPEELSDAATEEDQDRPQATIEVGGAAPSPGPATPSEPEGPTRPTGADTEPEPAPQQEPGDGPVVISGHQIRAEDKRWQHLLDTQGREAARQEVDADVYDKMRQRFRRALAADKDVHLVMPSNDPAMVREFISMAREYGYEITVKATIPPNPVRVLGVVEQLHDQLTQGTPNRAMSTEEGGREHQNLRKILTDVHNEHLADRVELYPRTGVTTDTTPVIRDHLIGSPDNPRWSLGRPIEKHINDLEKAEVTPEEDHRLRTRVPEMAEGILPDDQVLESQRWAHEQVKEGLNYLTSTNAERQPFKDSARRTTMDLAGEAVATTERPEPPHEDRPPLPEEPHPEEEMPLPSEEPHPEEEHAAAADPEREPAMAGAPSREEALAAARTPRPGTSRRPPPSPKPEPGAPGPKAGAASRVHHGPRQ